MLIGWGQNMSRNKQAFGPHFPALCRRVAPYSRVTMTSSSTSLLTGAGRQRVVARDLGFAPVQFVVALLSSAMWTGLCALAALVSPAAHAQVASSAATLQSQVQDLLKQQTLPHGADGGAQGAPKQAWRVEVVLGQLDPRLKLAPCDQVRAYMPAGVQMWGKTRVGLRCEQGAVRWNVFWPVTVKVWGQALVAAVPLRPGNVINLADLNIAEVDLAAQASPAVVSAAEVVGRAASRNIEPGQSLRQEDIKARRWFAAGDLVRLTVRGEGFQVASEGTALTPGDEGRCAKIRTDSGRVVCGQPVGDRRVELSL